MRRVFVVPTMLPWTQADLASVERALKRYKTAGLQASCDLDRRDEGIVSISQLDPRRPNAPIVIFEIHKLARSDRSEQAHWVVQIMSIGGADQVLRQHGCVSANAAVFAIAKAEQDQHRGFVASDSFDLAANSYWLK